MNVKAGMVSKLVNYDDRQIQTEFFKTLNTLQGKKLPPSERLGWVTFLFGQGKINSQLSDGIGK